MTHEHNAPETGCTPEEQAAWHAGIEAGRDIERGNAAAQEPVAWMTPGNGRAITELELSRIPTDRGRQDRCREIYPVPLYAAPVAAQARFLGTRSASLLPGTGIREGENPPNLTLYGLMAPYHLQHVTGQDLLHLLSFGRDVWRAAQAQPVVNQSLTTDTPKRRPYNASGSLSEYGVFPECDAQQPVSDADGLPDTGLLDRLRIHAEDKRNTAFSRSTMREVIQLLERGDAQPQPSGNAELPPMPVYRDSCTASEFDRRVLAWGQKCFDAGRAALAAQASGQERPLIARALADWHEDDGPVAWWAWCGHEWAGEPAWIGTPLDSDWPGYHTHWTAHPAIPWTEERAAAKGEA